MSDQDVGKKALTDYRMQRSRETLQDAHLLYDKNGSAGSVINRAYYAMFYAVLALLTLVGEGAAKHSGVIALFDRHLVKSGRFPKEMSKAIHRAFDLRQIGDYRELVSLDKERAEETLHTADQFVETVERYLKANLEDQAPDRSH